MQLVSLTLSDASSDIPCSMKQFWLIESEAMNTAINEVRN